MNSQSTDYFSSKDCTFRIILQHIPHRSHCALKQQSTCSLHHNLRGINVFYTSLKHVTFLTHDLNRLFAQIKAEFT